MTGECAISLDVIAVAVEGVCAAGCGCGCCIMWVL